jgi:predicted ATPase
MELRQHPPLVGRRTIVAKLVALLADAQVAGRPAAVFLEGPAGIGKSRLVAELIANANDRDFAVLALDHHPLETDRPFSAFRNTRDADTSLPHALYRSLSGLDEVGDGPAITARIVRFETADRIVSALVEWSELRPLLLTVDDLQWADEATLVVLHRLAMRLESARIALVCAARLTMPSLRKAGEPTLPAANETRKLPKELTAKVAGLFRGRAG